MKIYNQLTRKVQDFVPLKAGEVSIYTCGPTVYDHIQIGNLMAYTVADTLHRTLSASGLSVKRAMNYTDVDDKTIRRSRETYSDMEPRAALTKLTDIYIDVFLHDMQRIGNDTASLHFLRATETIAEMQALINQLLAKKIAYIADDGIYFSIEAYQRAGKKYGQLLKLTVSNTSEARIQNDEYDKDSVHDFALWKKAQPGEPTWEFIIDGQDLTGRPGWHIECSAMSHKALGQPFDIHTGGIDNMFPHHENEIAQSTALEDSSVFAAYFTYNNHLLVDGKKMSKSAKNFYTIDDVLQRGFDPLAFRLAILQGHYQSQINFTWDSLQAAQNRLTSLRAMADLRFQVIQDDSAAHDFVAAGQKVLGAMQDNLDTPQALAILSNVEGEVNDALVTTEGKEAFEDFLALLDKLLGLQLLSSTDITAEHKALVTARQAAREAKDFAKADELRAQLEAAGILVRDTPYGTIWQRK